MNKTGPFDILAIIILLKRSAFVKHLSSSHQHLAPRPKDAYRKERKHSGDYTGENFEEKVDFTLVSTL